MNVITYSSAINLGNHLFQIAFAFRLNRQAPVFYVTTDAGRRHLQPCRELCPEITCTGTLPPGLTPFRDADLAAADFVLPQQRDNLLLDGFFQNQQLFDRRELIRRFPCPARIRDHLFAVYGEILRDRNPVGISVRRGDYLGLPHRHPFAGRGYFIRAIRRFPADTTFIVCSDDIPWCRTFFTARRFPGRTFIFIEHEEILAQLFIHTFCRHNIISNSSFSWWGAVLNPTPGQRILFPSRWFGMQIREPARLYLPDAEIVRSAYTPARFLHACFCCVKNAVGDRVRKMRRGR